MQEKIKVIIVDDHEFFRKGVALTISKLKYAEVVGEASNGKEFLDMLKTTKADIVLIDIRMPVMNGIDATIEALSLYPDLKIVALSMFGEEEYIENMLEAGVKGFLLKNITKNDLDRALKLVISGKNFYSEELMTYFTKKIIKKQEIKENTEKLTKRELEVLQLLVKGYTNQEIAEKLFISHRTVCNHRANILSKTGTKNTANLLTYAIKNNLVKI